MMSPFCDKQDKSHIKIDNFTQLPRKITLVQVKIND